MTARRPPTLPNPDPKIERAFVPSAKGHAGYYISPEIVLLKVLSFFLCLMEMSKGMQYQGEFFYRNIMDSPNEHSVSCLRVNPCVSEAHCGYPSFHKYVSAIGIQSSMHVSAHA